MATNTVLAMSSPAFKIKPHMVMSSPAFKIKPHLVMSSKAFKTRTNTSGIVAPTDLLQTHSKGVKAAQNQFEPVTSRQESTQTTLNSQWLKINSVVYHRASDIVAPVDLLSEHNQDVNVGQN